MDMLELLMNRRSIRKYKKKEIEKEKVEYILKAALTSPSGRNVKPWELLVVTDKGILSKLGESRGEASKQIAEAALGIVVVADPSLTDIWIEDASIISTIIQVTAQSLELGSCWIQVRERKNSNGDSIENIVKNILKISTEFRIESMIAIGYPDEEKEPHNESSLVFDKIHYNSYK